MVLVIQIWLYGVVAIGLVCAVLNVPVTFRNIVYVVGWMLIGISMVFQILPPIIVLCLPETKEAKEKHLRQAAEEAA